MDSALQTFTAILRNNSDHITHARLCVFKALYGKGPQTMQELYTNVEDPIDRASVYRAITLFDKRGIIHKVQIGWKYKIELSDIFVAHHHHISCLQCGRVFAIQEDAQIEQLIAQIAAKNHIYQPVHQLEIQGYCERCAQYKKMSRLA